MTKNKQKRHLAEKIDIAVNSNQEKVLNAKNKEIAELWDRIHFLEKENEELKKPK